MRLTHCTFLNMTTFLFVGLYYSANVLYFFEKGVARFQYYFYICLVISGTDTNTSPARYKLTKTICGS